MEDAPFPMEGGAAALARGNRDALLSTGFIVAVIVNMVVGRGRE